MASQRARSGPVLADDAMPDKLDYAERREAARTRIANGDVCGLPVWGAG